MSQKIPKEQSMSTIKKQSKLCVPQIRMSCATVRCSVWTTDKCRSHLRLVKCSLVTSGLLARKLKHDLRLKIDDNIGWWGWWSPLPLWLSSTWWWWWQKPGERRDKVKEGGLVLLHQRHILVRSASLSSKVVIMIIILFLLKWRQHNVLDSHVYSPG